MVTLPLEWAPHIADEIVAHMDGPTLLSARLVDRDMRRFANEILVAKCTRVEIRRREQELVFISQGVALPFSHPSSPLDLQYAAMREARTVIIGRTVPSSDRLNDLLAQLSPRAKVRIEHSRFWNSHHVFPKLRCPELDVPAGCECTPGNRAQLKHQARVVRVNILFQDFLRRPTCFCRLVRGISVVLFVRESSA